MRDELQVIIIGASGGIGRAITHQLSSSKQVKRVYAFSRRTQVFSSLKITPMSMDFSDEDQIRGAAQALKNHDPIDLIIIATGFLHDDDIHPEKTMRAMSMDNFQANFTVNTFGPALTAKHFLPLMRKNQKTVFATLSARVGSISDNRLGGWYAYRASKAALNMITKSLAIENGRRNKDCIIIGLHPGTVDTPLSKPFQNNVSKEKLFSVENSAQKLITVIDQVTSDDSGYLLDWAGLKIPF